MMRTIHCRKNAEAELNVQECDATKMNKEQELTTK